MPAPISESHQKILATFGASMRRLRKAKGWTQDDMAQAMGYKMKTRLAENERAQGRIPLCRALDIAKILDTTLEAMLGGEGAPVMQSEAVTRPIDLGVPGSPPEPLVLDAESAAAAKVAEPYDGVQATVELDGNLRAVVCRRVMVARLPLGTLSVGVAVSRCARALASIPRPKP